jgi:hypothetical protein
MRITHLLPRVRPANRLGSILLLVVFSILQSYAQTSPSLTFEYKSPRNGKAVGADDFLSGFVRKLAIPVPGCYFAMSTCRFRVSKTGVVNRITWEGELMNELKVAMEQQLMESQKYWKCEGCEEAYGYWVTMPVFIAYASDVYCSSISYPYFYQYMGLLESLFKENEKRLIHTSDSEWLLAPLYSTILR